MKIENKGDAKSGGGARIMERDRRIGILNQIMEELKLDGLFFTSTAQQTAQMAVKYATGYALITRRDICLMKKGEMPVLVVPTVGQQFHARRQTWLPPGSRRKQPRRRPFRWAPTPCECRHVWTEIP